MKGGEPLQIWTIGHSTHPLETFIEWLQSFSITVLVDVRNFPGSRRYPQFNREALEQSLPLAKIRYLHFKDLGGRRKPLPDSVNTVWRNLAFRGYADYMQTETFLRSLAELEVRATEKRTVIMCAEAVWWSCHRSLISDALKVRGWKVWHITGPAKCTEHRYTSAARIVDGKLRYDTPDLFS